MKEYIERDKICGTESLLMSDIVEENPVAKYILEQVLFDIKETPAADVRENIHAEWKLCLKNNGKHECRCSNCNALEPKELQWGEPLFEKDNNYCYKCGAKMKKPRWNFGT